MPRFTLFTKEQDDYLKANFITQSMAELMAAIPGIKRQTIHKRARRFGLVKPKPQKGQPAYRRDDRRTWLDEHIEFVRVNFPTMETIKICEIIGKTVKMVTSKATHLGVKKDKSIKWVRPVNKPAKTPKVKISQPKPKTAPNIKVAKATPAEVRSKKREPKVFKSKPILYLGTPVFIKELKATVYAKPGQTVDQVRQKYLNRQNSRA